MFWTGEAHCFSVNVAALTAPPAEVLLAAAGAGDGAEVAGEGALAAKPMKEAALAPLEACR